MNKNESLICCHAQSTARGSRSRTPSPYERELVAYFHTYNPRGSLLVKHTSNSWEVRTIFVIPQMQHSREPVSPRWGLVHVYDALFFVSGAPAIAAAAKGLYPLIAWIWSPYWPYWVQRGPKPIKI